MTFEKLESVYLEISHDGIIRCLKLLSLLL